MSKKLIKLSKLLEILDNGGLYAVFQPQLSLDGRVLCGAETLARVKMHGMDIPPSAFVPFLEANGKIDRLDMAVARLAARAAARRNIKIAVNLSALSLSPETAPALEKICGDEGAQTSLIELELTESVLADNNAAETLSELKQRGFSLAADDFGAGYSSLLPLCAIEANTLKLDRGFVETGPSERAFEAMRCAAQLAKRLKMTALCEGIENEKQLRAAEKAGFTHGQGFLFARPLSARQLAFYARRFPGNR